MAGRGRRRPPAAVVHRARLRRRRLAPRHRPRALAVDRRPSPAATGPCSTGAGSTPPRPPAGRRAWLTFDGLFYQGDCWLDGGYLGDTEGYFLPHSFEVTGALRDRSEHALAVEVTCTPQHGSAAKRNITGIFQHWDAVDPTWNPGGLWRPVRLTETGPVRIASLRVICAEATPERAVLAVRALLDSDAARRVRLRTEVGALDHEVDQPLAAGTNEVNWSVTIDRPGLWWPRALGDAGPARRAGGGRAAGEGDGGDGAPPDARRPRAVTRACAVARRAGRRQRRAPAAHRPAVRPPAALDRLGQRRAPVPQGHQPGPHPHGARRGHARRAAPRRRPGRRRRARPGPRPRPRHPRRGVRPGRRARAARVAGHAAAMGLRPQHPQAGHPPGPGDGRPARPPPVDRRVVRAQRAGVQRRRRPDRLGPAQGPRLRRPA